MSGISQVPLAVYFSRIGFNNRRQWTTNRGSLLKVIIANPADNKVITIPFV
jgi:hypothetical protein